MAWGRILCPSSLLLQTLWLKQLIIEQEEIKLSLEPSSQLVRFHNAGFCMLFENSKLNIYFALLPPMSLWSLCKISGTTTEVVSDYAASVSTAHRRTAAHIGWDHVQDRMFLDTHLAAHAHTLYRVL